MKGESIRRLLYGGVVFNQPVCSFLSTHNTTDMVILTYQLDDTLQTCEGKQGFFSVHIFSYS